MDSLNDIINQYLEALWEQYPVKATEVGVHTQDDHLPDFTPTSVEARYQEDQEFASRFASLDARSLDTDAYLDREVALANLHRSIGRHEYLQPWNRDPCLYEQAVIQGVYSLIERDYAPLEQRARAVLSRLLRAPRLLRQARSNLTEETPRLFVDTALKEIAGGIEFLEEVIDDLIREIPSLESELSEASQSALNALAEYERFVGSLGTRCDGDVAVGKQYYNFLLKEYHLVDIDSQELLELGRQSIDVYQTELADLAKSIDPGRSWTAITNDLKRDHPPTTEGVLEMYQEEVDLARSFVLEHQLVTMPEENGFVVSLSPKFVWATIPFGSTHPPRPFEDDNTGFWEITPPDPTAPPGLQEQKLQGHNRWNARAIALHEAYPGHHMHYCIVKQSRSKIRRQFVDTVFVEGWGLYTEDLMWEAGYFDDPRVRLIQLVNALWRAVRIVVDVSLHTGLLSVEECIDKLVNISRLEPVNAAGEVARYAATPTQAASYLLGKTQILGIREACRRQSGDDFDLRAFHDELLSYGAISPLLVRDQMVVE